jgi:CBS-domain-containing membrane protein
MKLKKASDIMTHPVVTVRPDAVLTDAIKLMLRHHISGLPVVSQEGRLVGIVRFIHREIQTGSLQQTYTFKGDQFGCKV